MRGIKEAWVVVKFKQTQLSEFFRIDASFRPFSFGSAERVIKCMVYPSTFSTDSKPKLWMDILRFSSLGGFLHIHPT